MERQWHCWSTQKGHSKGNQFQPSRAAQEKESSQRFKFFQALSKNPSYSTIADLNMEFKAKKALSPLLRFCQGIFFNHSNKKDKKTETEC